MPNEDDNNIINEQASPDNPPVAEEPAAENPPTAEEPAAPKVPVVEEPPASDNPVADEPPATENPVTDAHPVEVGGAIKHQSEFNTDNGAYSQKTGATLDIKEGDNSYSAGLYMLTPQKFQIEGIYSRNLFSQNVTPKDNFGVSAAYRNQTNFSTTGVTTSNRFSVQQNYTHKFDNGWKVGAYANENVKVNFSSNGATSSVGYIAGVSAGKGKVSGYVENQGDLKLAKNPSFGSFINVGFKISL
ncbi:hypothetical protein IJI31_02710 [bacterium]|nr:hypothetical protein [bacterium]